MLVYVSVTEKYHPGGGGGKLGCNYSMCVQTSFLNLPQSYTWTSKKNDLFIYLMEHNVYIFIYCSLIFIPYLLSVNTLYK